MRIAVVPLLLLAAVAPVDSVCAQRVVEPGTRIRVTHRCAMAGGGEDLPCLPRQDAPLGRTAGAFLALRSDTLLLGRGGAPGTASFPLVAVSRVEISVGRRSHWLAGAGIGALVGVVSGTVWGYALTRHDESGVTVAIFPVLGAVLGAPIGLCTGAAVGLFVKTDRWMPIPMQRLGVTPKGVQEHSFGLSLTLPF